MSELQALRAGENRAEKTRAIKAAYETMRQRLAQLAPDKEREIGSLVNAVTVNDGRGATPTALDELAKKIAALRLDPPPGFLPPEKLKRAIEAARKAKPDGIIIFAAGSLDRENLWSTLEEAFKR